MKPLPRIALPSLLVRESAVLTAAERLSDYLANERLQRRLLGDLSYSREEYDADPLSAWESGACYTLAAALRPLLGTTTLLAGVYARYHPSDPIGELEHVALFTGGSLLDARGVREPEELLAHWSEIVATDSRLMRVALLERFQERDRYAGRPGSEPGRIEALRRLLARDLKEEISILRADHTTASRPART